jgi:crotonobetainyl-CoA:carnitine CoA-transferase CaiB-like acyl-CoA transferase
MSDLEGYLVVAVEQAVAAPYASSLLAEAGARVIKVEREGGDFARNYDHVVNGESAYFVWLNRGKESLCLDLKNAEDHALLLTILEQADVFIQNLKPGAICKLGLSYEKLSVANPALVMCSISGYGDHGDYAQMKAYDLLVQAESGLCSVTGTANESSRVGVSICDIATGLMAYGAILRALLARGKTGRGSYIDTSLFGVMADWMNVPLLHQAYGGRAPERMGICHPSIAPYGVFLTGDGKQLVISIQNEREWKMFCEEVLEDPSLAVESAYSTNVNRVANREQLDRLIRRCFSELSKAELTSRLSGADTAYGSLNQLEDVLTHPQLRQVIGDAPSGEFTLAATGAVFNGQPSPRLAVPEIGQHTEDIIREFGGQAGLTA